MQPTSEKALSAMEKGDLIAACSLFDQSIATETDPNALFQAALCYRKSGRLNDALSLLKRLEDQGQTNPPALLLRADIFCAVDRHHHALPLYQALSGIDNPQIQYSAALGLFQCSDIDAALKLASALAERATHPINDQAALLKGRCLAAAQRYDEARQTLGKIDATPALQKAATYRIARMDLHTGQFSAAEASLRNLLDLDEPPRGARETLLQSLVHSGQTDAALNMIREATDASSDLSWLRHCTELLSELDQPDPLQLLASRWDMAPGPEIFRELCNRLLEANDLTRAESLLKDYAKTFGQDAHWQWAHMRKLEKERAYEEILQCKQVDPFGSMEVVCHAHFALGRYAEALEAAQQLCRSAPGDQYFIALLVTALRCLDDPRQAALTDSALFLTEAEPQVPALEAGGATDFWRSVEDAIAHHHSMTSAPPTQSVVDGIQTPGNLLTQTAAPPLIALKALLDEVAHRFFDGTLFKDLAEPHPLRLFRPNSVSMHASWAIQAKAGTYHHSHVHSKGWYSGTCYVEVPESLNDSAEAGHLVLGEPPFETKDPLPPLATLCPKVGKIVLFPSYCWHSTRPYSGQGGRQVVAFDYGKANRFV